MKFRRIAWPLALAAFIGLAQAASAEDTVKLAVGQRGNWDTSVSEIGQQLARVPLGTTGHHARADKHQHRTRRGTGT